MKKILIIHPALPIGGAEKVLVTILKNFDYLKYDVELLLIYKGENYIDEIPKQVKISTVYPQNDSIRQKIDYSFYYKFDITLFEKLSVLRALKSKQYDTIVSFLEGRALKAHSYITDRAQKNISWIHTDMLNNHYTIDIGMKASFEKRAYSLMDEVVFVSKESMNQFNKLGYSVKNEAIIYNPIEKDIIQAFIPSAKRKNDVFTIVLCGRLVKVKAYDRIIRVARRLKDDGLQFRVNIIGDGREKEYLQSLIIELGLTGIVNLLGFVVPPFTEMSKADLFVSTSIAEGYPINICEAMCLGLPIVATQCTGTNEVLSDDDDFALLAEQDDDSIYNHIKRMMLDEAFRSECGRKALIASNRFDIQKTMDNIYQLLS